MYSWSEFLSRYPKRILLGLLVLTLILGFGIKHLTLDAETDNLLGIEKKQSFADKLPATTDYDRVNLVIAHDNTLFTQNKLEKLTELQQQLERIADIKSVTSLFNVPDIQRYFKDNTWHSVLEKDRIETETTQHLQHAALANKLLIHQLINPEATTLALVVEVKAGVVDSELLHVRQQIETLLQKNQSSFQELFQIGPVDVQYYSLKDSMHDVLFTASLALLTLIITFSWFFKSPFLGLAPLFTAGCAIIWTLGIMGYCHIHFNVMTALAVIMTYTVGTMENAHFINAYQKSLKENPAGLPKQHIDFMYRAVLFPLFLTTLSTVLGFMSNLFATITLLKSFAITISLAIVLNAILLCVLTPALLTFTSAKERKKIEFVWVKKITIAVYQKTIRYPVCLSFFLCSIIMFSFWASTKIPIETTMYSYYYEKSEFVQKIIKVGHLMSGVERLIINISVDEKKGVRQRDVLQKIFDAENRIRQLPMTSTTLSPASTEASMFQLMTRDESDEHYRVPHTMLVSNIIFDELKKSEEMRFLVSKDNSVTRIVVTYQSNKTQESIKYINTVKKILNDEFKNAPIRYEVASYDLEFYEAVQYLIKAQLAGISMIYVSIFIIMLILFRSFKAGLISIIPNIFPLSFIILVLYALNIPFSISSVVVLTAVLGMAVDDTLHILYYFKKNFLKSRNRDQAILDTIQMLVRPVTITTFTLMLGMSMLFFSVIKASMHYGFLMIVGAMAAWIANLTITPFLLKKIDITKRL